MDDHKTGRASGGLSAAETFGGVLLCLISAAVSLFFVFNAFVELFDPLLFVSGNRTPPMLLQRLGLAVPYLVIGASAAVVVFFVFRSLSRK